MDPEISFGGPTRSSAAGARIEAPQALRGWSVGGGVPLPTGGGGVPLPTGGGGCAPSPEIFFNIAL